MIRYAILVIIFTVTACQKIYWHRNKVAAIPRKSKLSIQLTIENRSPQIFEPNFNRRLQEVCNKEFERMGYTTKFKDHADLMAIVRIDLDSFVLPNDNKNTKPVARINQYTTSFFYGQRLHGVKAILFDYQIIFTKNLSIKWQEQNDIYYFDDLKRNSNRALGMIKYTFRNGK